MSDLRTIQEQDVGPYTVRVAKQETDDRYDAAVIHNEGMLMGKSVSDAPIADHDKKWVAIGKAVQQYNEAIQNE